VSVEALADRIDGLVCAESRQAFLRARTVPFVAKSKGQLQRSDALRDVKWSAQR
jgi:hypothetical protein